MLKGFKSESFDFDNGRVQYPEEIKARAPLGSRHRIRQAAESEGISMGEFIRRAIDDRIEAADRRRAD